ncbi:hypothetical protein BC940DRAFT_316531 [Gongronella butleri]|nr:hypothetical protein BC940DRAFT_316531 [Gongronella butleri]
MQEHPLTTEEPRDDVHHEQIKHLNEPVASDSTVAVIHTQQEPNLIDQASDSDDDSDSIDEALWQTTENNKNIPYTPDMKRQLTRNLTKKRNARNHVLVFQETPIVMQQADRYVVAATYGAGLDGTEVEPSTRRTRAYMVACDFSDESYNAMQYAMGSLLRDGDELHMVAVLNREDNPETVKKMGLSMQSELKMAAEKILEKAQGALEQMLLFNIKLTVHALAGRIKETLYQFIQDHAFTLVVCGSRGRSSVKGLFLGSVSSYLVHKSPAPVSVIKMKKPTKPTTHTSSSTKK